MTDRALITYTDDGTRITATVPDHVHHLIIRRARKWHRCQAAPAARVAGCREAIWSGGTYLEDLSDPSRAGSPYQGRRYCAYCGTANYAGELNIDTEPLPPASDEDRRTLEHLAQELTRALNPEKDRP